MKKAIKAYLPISEHRQAYVDKYKNDLIEWMERTGKNFPKQYKEQIFRIISNVDNVNPEFGTVMALEAFQTYLIAMAINGVYSGKCDVSSDLLSEVIGGLALQIPLDVYCYQDSLEYFELDEIVFGHGADHMFLVSCTALWLGGDDLVLQSHNWFKAYRRNGHLMEHSGDACFREFTLWMLASFVAGEVQSVVDNREIYGPYLALIDGFHTESLLSEEIAIVCDFHLYRSDDFPGADPFPSFYGVLGLFPAEILAFAALRKRIADLETDVSHHPLLPSEWQDIPPISKLIDPPFANEIRNHFKVIFKKNKS